MTASRTHAQRFGGMPNEPANDAAFPVVPIHFENVRLASKPYAYEHGGKLCLFFPVCPQVARFGEPA